MLPKLPVKAYPFSLPTISRRIWKPNFTISQAARVEYQIEVVEKGKVVYTHPKKSNLILNIGLDKVATKSWTPNIASISVGSNTVPVKRDSGTTTFIRAGTTVTASSAFFDPTDDDAGGRLLKFDTGEEMTVVTYVSALSAIVSVSGTLGASQGTLWYVNETVNTGEFMRFNNVEAQSEVFSVDTLAHTIRMISSAAVAANVAREIGWSDDNTANAGLFGRDLVAGGGVSIGIGQQYRVTLTLFVTYSPSSGVAYPDVGNNGFNTAGTACFGPIQNNVQILGGGLGGLDPSSIGGTSIGLYSFNFSLPPLSYTIEPGGIPLNFSGVCSSPGYTSGNYYRDLTTTLGVSQANGTLYGVCVGGNNGGFAGAGRAWNLLFTTPQTKDNLHNLALTVRNSWQRVLIN